MAKKAEASLQEKKEKKEGFAATNAFGIS